MMLLIVGLIIFLGIHLIPTSPGLHQSLKERFGDNGYKIAFSIVSLIGLAVIVLGFHKLQLNPGKNPVLWHPPVWMRHITLALMLPAIIFLVASLIPSRIREMLRHPMLVAIKTWALAHLLANGDVASLLLFGSFLAYAVYDRISLKQRADRGPLGDKKPTGIINDVLVVGIGVAIYVALVMGGHEWLFGVAPMT